MNAGMVFGRYEYTGLFKALRTSFCACLFIISGSLIFAGGTYATGAVLSLLAGLLLTRLIVKYHTFSLTVDETDVRVEHLGTRMRIPPKDIVSVRTETMNTEESVYVRDRNGNRFSFEKVLDNYTELRSS